jgi:hypothetical protein
VSIRSFPWTLLAACVATAVNAVEVSVGGQVVQVPAPAGFVEASHLARVREMAEATTPQSNRLVAVFIGETDAELLRNGQGSSLGRYMFVQVARKSEMGTVSRAEFDEVKAVVKEQQADILQRARSTMGDLVDQVAESVSKQAEGPVDIDIGEPVPLGVIAEGDRFIAMGTLAKYQLAAAGRTIEYAVATGHNIVSTADKLLFVYVFALYRDQGDIQWMRDTSLAWSEQILAANAPSRFEVSDPSGFDWPAILRKTLIGALIGGLIGIGWAVMGRLRRNR